MLSIGKLATGQAKYYLEQAEVRVDAVGSVADGIEDYYGEGGQARGQWLGIGARELGLAGVVDGDQLRRVLDGLDPWTGAPLRASRSPVRVSGFDLTFSAPKSVSVVYALGKPEIQEAVRRGHDRAVAEGDRLRRAVGCDGSARRRRSQCRARDRADYRRVPSSHVAARRPAAPHARPRREPRARTGRALVGA